MNGRLHTSDVPADNIERSASGAPLELAHPMLELPEWAHDAREPQPVRYTAEAFERLLIAAEREDANRPGLAATPDRAARAWAELTAGYSTELELTTFDADGHDEIVAVAEIPFYSLCEHHLLPFHGSVHIAYLPGKLLLGLSKFARIVHCYARRLQLQERLTTQIADCIEDAVDPQGVAVIVRADQHLCMAMRGVQSQGRTTTSVQRGLFKHAAQTRAEALQLLGL